MKKIHFWMIAMALCCFNCNNPELNHLDFFGVALQSLDAEGLNGVRPTGQVIAQGETATGECGFIWSYERALVEQNSTGAQWIQAPFPKIDSDGQFNTVIVNLERGKTIWIRAYAKASDADAGERMVFSENIEEFTVGEIVALTGNAEIVNNTAVLFGQLRGLETIKKEVTAYGHVISSTNPLPTLGCDSCYSTNRGSSKYDAIFSSQISDLKFNTDYFVRAYAIDDAAIDGPDTFYSIRSDTFRIRDGWVRISDFPELYSEGVGVAIESKGKAYAGFGCSKFDGPTCLLNELNKTFWEFDPMASNEEGTWTIGGTVDKITIRTNVAAFAIDPNPYVIFGDFDYGIDPLNVEFFCVEEFGRFNQIMWEKLSPIAANIEARTGAVAFVLKNGKAYVGSGLDEDRKELNDFWEYNPQTGAWRPVAPMPLQKNPDDVPEDKGRFEAVAFTLGDYGYVGTGQFGATTLRDFWRFRPPVDDNDPGEWVRMAPLPPEATARYQAVAFSIDNRGYVATGYHPDAGYLNDVWQYEPDSGIGKWTQKTPFQGVARTNAIGFALSGYGYLGTGNTKVQLNGGLSSAERSLPDFWRYIPEQ